MSRATTRRRLRVTVPTIHVLAGALLLAWAPGARAVPAAPSASAPAEELRARVKQYLPALRGLNRPNRGPIERAWDLVRRPVRRGAIMGALASEVKHVAQQRDASGAPLVSHAELQSLVAELRQAQAGDNKLDATSFRQLTDLLTSTRPEQARPAQRAAAEPAAEPAGEPAAPPAALSAEASKLVASEPNDAARAAMVRALRESGDGAPALVVRQPEAAWPHDSASSARNPSVHALEPAGPYAGPSVVGRSLNMTHMGSVIEHEGARAASQATLQAMKDRRNGFLQHLGALHAQQLEAAEGAGLSGSAIAGLRERQARVRGAFLDAMGSTGLELIRDSSGMLPWRVSVRSSGEIGAEKDHLRGAVAAEKKHRAWVRRSDTAAANQAQFETKKTHWVTMGAGALALGAVMLSVTGVGLATLPLLLQGSTALAAWTQIGMVAGGVAVGGGAGQYVANRVQGLRAGINGMWLRAADQRKEKAAALHRATLSYYNLNPNAPAANENHFSSPQRDAFRPTTSDRNGQGAEKAPAGKLELPGEAPESDALGHGQQHLGLPGLGDHDLMPEAA